MQTCIVLITCPQADSAQTIAQALVVDGLAACVNIIPNITSVYRWEGEVKNDSEVLLLVKCIHAQIAELEARVLALHPYDTPEFIVFAAEHVTEKYQRWLEESVKS